MWVRGCGCMTVWIYAISPCVFDSIVHGMVYLFTLDRAPFWYSSASAGARLINSTQTRKHANTQKAHAHKHALKMVRLM